MRSAHKKKTTPGRIINIRGTHGSGKTTVVTRTIDAIVDSNVYSTPAKLLKPRARVPLIYGYEYKKVIVPSRTSPRPLTIIGKYEGSATGGCDAISGSFGTQDTLDLAEKWRMAGCNVLLEGVMLGEDKVRARATWPKDATLILLLTTPFDECLESVNARRAARGSGPLEDLKAIRAKYRTARRAAQMLEGYGFDVRYVDREEAFELVKKELDL